MKKDINVPELIRDAKKARKAKHYNQAALLCSTALETMLKNLYLLLLSKIPNGRQRLKLVQSEMNIGRGRGIESFHLGQIMVFYKKASLFKLAEQLLKINLVSARKIDFVPLVNTRNRAVNAESEITHKAADKLIFHTQALFKSLRTVIG